MARVFFNDPSGEDSIKQHSISDFLFDEEASIPRGKLLLVGSLMIILAFTLGVQDAFAKHRSHRSHRSSRTGHSSHYSHTSHASGGHSNHGSHSNHSDHASHSNHSNHASHSSATATPRPTATPVPTLVPGDEIKIPRNLPDTFPLE